LHEFSRKQEDFQGQIRDLKLTNKKSIYTTFVTDLLSKQNVMLGTKTKLASDRIHVGANVFSVDSGSSRGRREQASQHRHGGGLAGPIVSKE